MIQQELNRALFDTITIIRYTNETSRLNCIAVLIDNGVDVNYQDENGWTPLMKATTWCRTEIVQLLIENKVDVDLQDKYGNTALMMAILWDRTGIATFLISKGADVNCKDIYGKTALDIANEKLKYYKEDCNQTMVEKIEKIIKLLTNI